MVHIPLMFWPVGQKKEFGMEARVICMLCCNE